MLRRGISQVRRGVAHVRLENPPCYSGVSRRRAEVLRLYAGVSRRRAEGIARTMGVQRLMNRPALSVTLAFLLQDGGQDAWGGQDAGCPAKCMRWTRRKVRAAGKMHEVDKTQATGKMHGAGKRRSKENTRRKTTGAARCWAHNPLHESTKKIAPCARILYNTLIRSLAPSHCHVVAPSD